MTRMAYVRAPQPTIGVGQSVCLAAISARHAKDQRLLVGVVLTVHSGFMDLRPVPVKMAILTQELLHAHNAIIAASLVMGPVPTAPVATQLRLELFPAVLAHVRNTITTMVLSPIVLSVTTAVTHVLMGPSARPVFPLSSGLKTQQRDTANA